MPEGMPGPTLPGDRALCCLNRMACPGLVSHMIVPLYNVGLTYGPVAAFRIIILPHPRLALPGVWILVGKLSKSWICCAHAQIIAIFF